MADLTGALTHLQPGAWPGQVYGDTTKAAPSGPTRFYPTVQAPSAVIHGPMAGDWNDGIFGRAWTPVHNTWRLTTTKTNPGTRTTRAIRTNQQGDFDVVVTRWMTKPLAAQSISGTIQLCFGVQAVWVPPGMASTNDSIVRFKLHAYVANGESHTVRTVLVDNAVDTVDFPGLGGHRWRSFDVAPSFGATSIEDGDVIVVELGFRVVSSPTPTPQYYPDDTGFTSVNWLSTGFNTADPDATAGSSATNIVPWVEFSDAIVEKSDPAAPANDACADAIDIAALPYHSSFINTTTSTDADKAVWWKITAPQDGWLWIAAFGSNYTVQFNVYTGGCGALTAIPAFLAYNSTRFGQHRSFALYGFQATQGVEYHIRARQVTTSGQVNAPNTGGSCRVSAFYRETPQEDDLYLPAGIIGVLREGEYINGINDLFGSAPTGVAIDYTGRSMDDLNGGTHTGERLLVGLHQFELVEILDLPTLNAGEFEVDYIGDPWSVPIVSIHPAQLYVDDAGLLYAGWFGNGYLYILGEGLLPAILNTVSNNPDYSALKTIDATSGDNQPGAPFSDTLYYPTIEHTAPWAFDVDEANGIIYYASSGFYIPVGGVTDEIRRYSLSSGQLTTFATITLVGTNNPGLKGLQLLPGGGMLVCNGEVVHRLDNTGAIITTYTPSIPLDSQSLVDVCLTADGTAFWVVDEPSTRLFKFDIATGVELLTVQPYWAQGTLCQMTIYQPNGVTEPPTPEIPCPPNIEAATCLGPAPQPHTCIGDPEGDAGCIDGFTISDLEGGRLE